MTYMWPNYFSLGRLASLRHGYDLYLYNEGQHSFPTARKVHLLSCSDCSQSAYTNYSGTMLTSVLQMLHCRQLLVGQCSLCMEVMAVTSRYEHGLSALDALSTLSQYTSYQETIVSAGQITGI